MYYRRFLLRYVLSKIDLCDTASDVVKSVNILSAIRWVSEAWSLVHSETISKCFREVRGEIQTLISKSMPVDERCTLEEYPQGDGNLPVFMEQDDENWDVNFMEELGEYQQDEDDSDRVTVKEGVVDIDLEQPRSKITYFNEVLLALEDIYAFLQAQKGKCKP